MLCIDIPISVRPFLASHLVVTVLIEAVKAMIHCNHRESDNVKRPCIRKQIA